METAPKRYLRTTYLQFTFTMTTALVRPKVEADRNGDRRFKY